MFLTAWQKWPRKVMSPPSSRRTRGKVRHTSRRLNLEVLEDRSLPSTFTVINSSDSGSGSLRQALLDANAAPGADLIAFNIGNGHQTITPASALPDITDPLIIDGTTQPGYAGSPLIELRGSGSGIAIGLTLAANDSVVRGLVINGFNVGYYPDVSAGIYITG